MSSTPAARLEGWRAAVQAGTAAGLSWWIATSIIEHANPVSAPVVAVIAIGAGTGRRARRTIDVIFGLTIGIALASALVATVGRTAPLLALVVAAAMLAARATRDGEVLMTQAGIAAILVFATQHDATTSAALARVGDALIGGASAALVSLFVLPPDPVRLIRSRLGPLHAELCAILADIARGLHEQDAERAAAALERARASSRLVDELYRTRPVADEIARFVPIRWRTRVRVARLNAAAIGLDHASRNTRVIARAAVSLLAAEDPARHDCAAATAALADAIRQLDPSEPGNPTSRARAEHAARTLAVLHDRTPSPALGAIAAAARGITDDLASAQSTGLPITRGCVAQPSRAR